MEPEDLEIATLVIRRGLVSFDRVRECLEEGRKNGRRLRDLLFEKGLITAFQFEELRRGGEEADGILDDSRFCEAVIRRGLLGFREMYDVLRMRDKYRKGDRLLKSVDELLVEMGYLTLPQIQSVRGSSAMVRIDLPEKTQTRIGEVAVRLGYITEDQLRECLEVQGQERAEKGDAPRLGEILIRKGYLTPDQLDEILTRHLTPQQVLKVPGYVIEGRIGAGGMGEIYKARQLSVDRPVAIKVLHLKFARDPEHAARFVREAKLMAKLDHPYIVKVIDAGQVGDTYYYVMEYIDGATVMELIKKKGRLPERDCVKVAMYVSHALEHARRNGMVHRDVKPSNIMITRDGMVKLCDLGIAKLVREGDTEVTRSGLAVGSPYYISPEAALGSPVDIRSDLYSLGASLYHCAVGRPPFVAPTLPAILAMQVHQEPIPPREANPELSEEFSALVMRLLRKSPAERPSDPAEVARLFEGLLRGRSRAPGPAESLQMIRTVSAPAQPTVVVKRGVSWTAVLLAVFLAVAVVGGGAAYVLHRAGVLRLPW